MLKNIFDDTNISCSVEVIDMTPHFVIRHKSNNRMHMVACGEIKKNKNCEQELIILCFNPQSFFSHGGKIVPPCKYEFTSLFSNEKVFLSSFNSYFTSRRAIKKAIKKVRAADINLLRTQLV